MRAIEVIKDYLERKGYPYDSTEGADGFSEVIGDRVNIILLGDGFNTLYDFTETSDNKITVRKMDTANAQVAELGTTTADNVVALLDFLESHPDFLK